MLTGYGIDVAIRCESTLVKVQRFGSSITEREIEPSVIPQSDVSKVNDHGFGSVGFIVQLH